MSEKLSVAVLGAGIMGAAMARNIAKAGHDVTVWNRTRDKAEATGLPTAATPAEAVRHADVVLTMLFDGATVREVIEQAADALRPGGRLLLVANRHLPYEAALADGFDAVRELAARDGFKVVEARATEPVRR